MIETSTPIPPIQPVSLPPSIGYNTATTAQSTSSTNSSIYASSSSLNKQPPTLSHHYQPPATITQPSSMPFYYNSNNNTANSHSKSSSTSSSSTTNSSRLVLNNLNSLIGGTTRLVVDQSKQFIQNKVNHVKTSVSGACNGNNKYHSSSLYLNSANNNTNNSINCKSSSNGNYFYYTGTSNPSSSTSMNNLNELSSNSYTTGIIGKNGTNSAINYNLAVALKAATAALEKSKITASSTSSINKIGGSTNNLAGAQNQLPVAILPPSAKSMQLQNMETKYISYQQVKASSAHSTNTNNMLVNGEISTSSASSLSNASASSTSSSPKNTQTTSSNVNQFGPTNNLYSYGVSVFQPYMKGGTGNKSEMIEQVDASNPTKLYRNTLIIDTGPVASINSIINTNSTKDVSDTKQQRLPGRASNFNKDSKILNKQKSASTEFLNNQFHLSNDIKGEENHISIGKIEVICNEPNKTCSIRSILKRSSAVGTTPTSLDTHSALSSPPPPAPIQPLSGVLSKSLFSLVRKPQPIKLNTNAHSDKSSITVGSPMLLPSNHQLISNKIGNSSGFKKKCQSTINLTKSQNINTIDICLQTSVPGSSCSSSNSKNLSSSSGMKNSGVSSKSVSFLTRLKDNGSQNDVFNYESNNTTTATTTSPSSRNSMIEDMEVIDNHSENEMLFKCQPKQAGYMTRSDSEYNIVHKNMFNPVGVEVEVEEEADEERDMDDLDQIELDAESGADRSSSSLCPNQYYNSTASSTHSCHNQKGLSRSNRLRRAGAIESVLTSSSKSETSCFDKKRFSIVEIDSYSNKDDIENVDDELAADEYDDDDEEKALYERKLNSLRHDLNSQLAHFEKTERCRMLEKLQRLQQAYTDLSSR